MKKNYFILEILVLISALLILGAMKVAGSWEGLFLFGWWNLLPLLFFYLGTKKYWPRWGDKNIPTKISLVLLFICLLGFPTANGAAWLAGVIPQDAQAGLLFLFIPFWALVFATVPALILYFSASGREEEEGEEEEL